MSDLAAPLDRYRDVVRPDWIDHNQHMNMGYYLVVFDYATDEFFDWVGLDAAHRAAHAITTFCLEAHVTYHREVREGDTLRSNIELEQTEPLASGGGLVHLRSRVRADREGGSQDVLDWRFIGVMA